MATKYRNRWQKQRNDAAFRTTSYDGRDRVVVVGVNYCGEQASSFNQRIAIVELIGNPTKIANYIIASFTNASIEEYRSITSLITAINEQRIDMFNKCGGVLKITIGRRVVVDVRHSSSMHRTRHEDDRGVVKFTFSVDVDQLTLNEMRDDLNRRIQAAVIG